MRLEYISHSCFVIHTGQTKIAFDPWITGSAYHNQWHLFPRPVDTSSVEQADLILISHGHEDHLHHESLKRISKDAHIFFPFQWREGVVGYLQHLQFEKITEAISFKTYRIQDVQITYLGYSLESVIVVECEGQVLVNINDALNSNHETAVEFLLNKIKTRWPKIDYLLSGWSGAGYFPNKVHYKSKDDDEVARIREQYFADNFCRFTKFLQPDIAIPFAPGFVLLTEENRWINKIKFPRKIVDEYYRDNFEKETHIQFPISFPGDYFIDKEFYKTSEYHSGQGDQQIYDNLENEFKDEIEQAKIITYVSDEDLERLRMSLVFWLNKNKTIYHPDVAKDAVFSVRLKDVSENNFFNIYSEGGELCVKRNDRGEDLDRLVITTSARLLSDNLEKPWGGDYLSIGYGLDVDVFDELTLEKNLDIVCVRLISRYPNFKDDSWKHAGRLLKYYLNNPALTNLWIKQKLRLRPYVNKYPFNERDHWITFRKCDLCKVCKIPELDFSKLGEEHSLLN